MSGVKRAFDVVVVVVTAPFSLLVMLLVALLIRLDSKGPVIFSQIRMGWKGHPFRLYKLRTMREAAKAPEGALFDGWTYAGDPRVTRVGRTLRRLRIDELPQLWNVLRGDMSIVGPRPEPFEIAVALCEQIPGYAARHNVRPGITGLCQVSPAYLDFGTIEKSRIKLGYDLEYVEKASLGLDLRILFRTLRVVFGGKGIA
jgi:lipopolysaccharide/colanic/teichoic acid biosynthesis glycosyltransferase